MCYNKSAKGDIPTEIENSAAVRNIKIKQVHRKPPRVSTRRYTPMRTHN